MQGYNGSQLWDTAFVAQALAAGGPTLAAKHALTLQKAYAYFDASQVKEDVPNRTSYYRTVSKGGWPFSTSDHGWPIADCTSEGLKAVLALKALHSAGLVPLGGGGTPPPRAPRPGWVGLRSDGASCATARSRRPGCTTR